MSFKVLKNCQHFFCHVKLAGALMIAYMYVYLCMRKAGGQARRCKRRQGHATFETYFRSSLITLPRLCNILQLFCKTGQVLIKKIVIFVLFETLIVGTL